MGFCRDGRPNVTRRQTEGTVSAPCSSSTLPSSKLLSGYKARAGDQSGDEARCNLSWGLARCRSRAAEGPFSRLLHHALAESFLNQLPVQLLSNEHHLRHPLLALLPQPVWHALEQHMHALQRGGETATGVGKGLAWAAE